MLTIIYVIVWIFCAICCLLCCAINFYKLDKVEKLFKEKAIVLFKEDYEEILKNIRK